MINQLYIIYIYPILILLFDVEYDSTSSGFVNFVINQDEKHNKQWLQ